MLRALERELYKDLEEEPRTVPSASTWPPRTNAPAWGVSTRDSSHFKVHQTSPTYTFAPKQGVSGGDENAEPDTYMTQHNLCIWHDTSYNTSYVYDIRYVHGRHKIWSPSEHSPTKWGGPERATVLELRRGIFQYNNVLVQTVRREVRIEKTSLHHRINYLFAYQYRELYSVYGKSAGCKLCCVQFDCCLISNYPQVLLVGNR